MPSGEYDPETVERQWQERWVEEDLYAYGDGAVDPDTVFAIDSPPPTVAYGAGPSSKCGSGPARFCPPPPTVP